FGGNAFSVIGDGEEEGAGVRGGAEIDFDDGIGGRVFDRVVDQIDESLLDRFAVEGGMGGDVGGDCGFQTQFARGGVGLHEGGGFLDEGGEIGRFEIVFAAAALDAGEVEDVLHKRGEAATFLHDEFEVVALFL